MPIHYLGIDIANGDADLITSAMKYRQRRCFHPEYVTWYHLLSGITPQQLALGAYLDIIPPAVHVEPAQPGPPRL